MPENVIGALNLGSGGPGGGATPLGSISTQESMGTDILLVVDNPFAFSTPLLDVKEGELVLVLAPNMPDEGIGGIPKSSIHGIPLVASQDAALFSILQSPPIVWVFLETDTASDSPDLVGDMGSGLLAEPYLSHFPAIPSAGTDFLLYSFVDKRDGTHKGQLAFRSLVGVNGLTISATDTQIVAEVAVTGTTAVTNSTTVPGTGTRFTEELAPGHQLRIGGGETTVLAINSDTEIIVDTAVGDGTTQTIEVMARSAAGLSLPTMSGGTY